MLTPLIVVPFPIVVPPTSGTISVCVTVRLWPAMVSVALRLLPILPAAVTVTDPLPVPAAGLTVTHPAGDVAVQAQLGSLAVTDRVLGPPILVYATLAGLILYVHVNPWPCAWLSVNTALPALITAFRAAPELAPAVQPIVPFPVPLAPLPIVNHPSLEEAVHPHV
jgi:hypothetical protein